ncbi:MAG: hypothetical protein RI894_950 [Bacteroidota bacterium]
MQTLKILFLGANPRDTTRIRIDEELREIDNQLRLSAGRDRLSLGQKWAVRPDDLQQSLVDSEPQIVHFSGHGSSLGICLEDEQGNSKEVNAEALSDLFALFKGTVKCVLLNSCYSEAQATAISQYVPYVIGMSDAMPDEAATRFSVGFYKAIAAGKTVEFAFNLGVNAIKLEGLGFEQLPKLLKTSENLVLLQALSATINTENTPTLDEATVKRKWWLYGGIAAIGIALAGFLGYIFGESQPTAGLQYRISNASMDIFEKSVDSFKLTFDVVADNNSLKTCDFIRDSFSLLLPNSDVILKPLREGRSRVSIKRNENVDLKVAFAIPSTTLSGSFSLNIGRPRGTVHIDYLYGAPIASNDLDTENDRQKELPNRPTESNDAPTAPNKNDSKTSSITVRKAKHKTMVTPTNSQTNSTTSSSKTGSEVSPIVSPAKPSTTATTPTPDLPKPQTEAVVVIPKEESKEASTRMNGGTIKCDPKLIQRMKPIERMRYEQEVMHRGKIQEKDHRQLPANRSFQPQEKPIK